RQDVRIAPVDVGAEEFPSGAEVEIGLVADAAVAADAIADALSGRRLAVTRSPWLAELRRARDENEAKLASVIASDAVPINPYRPVRRGRDALPRHAPLIGHRATIMGVL